MHKNGWEKRLGFFMRRCTLAVMLSAVLAVEMTAFSAWGEESAEGRESAAEGSSRHRRKQHRGQQRSRDGSYGGIRELEAAFAGWKSGFAEGK